MINCRGTSNKGEPKKFRTSCEIFARHEKFITHFAWGAKFLTPNENKQTLRNHFDHCAKFSKTMRKISHTQHHFCTLCETLRGMRSNFAPPKPFRTLCETQEAHVKMKGHLPILFKPPSRPSPKILISQAPMSLRIPHFPLPPCDLVLLHSISRPLHITSKRRTPRPLRAWTRGLPFIFDMVRTRRAPPAPSLRHTTRQRASLAQMPSDSPSQAMDAPLIPPSKGGEATRPSSLAS